VGSLKKKAGHRENKKKNPSGKIVLGKDGEKWGKRGGSQEGRKRNRKTAEECRRPEKKAYGRNY